MNIIGIHIIYRWPTLVQGGPLILGDFNLSISLDLSLGDFNPNPNPKTLAS